MLDEAIRTKLRDPQYLELHLAAIAAARSVGSAPWYDSWFLRCLETAKRFLAEVRPDALEEFLGGLEALHPPVDFKVTVLDGLFDPATRARILEITGECHAEMHKRNKQACDEYEDFGRQVIWDHPFFLQLQSELVPRVSELAGRPVEAGYNFLSLYGGTGKCAVHMDEPKSMYTLDYCIDQSEEWPIHFSKVTDWPTLETMREFDAEAVKSDPELEFAPYILRPNQALLFNGSSQWHYRDNIAPGGVCHLLFFHYYPAGCEMLVDPLRWDEYFDIPELQPLCDILAREKIEAQS